MPRDELGSRPPGQFGKVAPVRSESAPFFEALASPAGQRWWPRRCSSPRSPDTPAAGSVFCGRGSVPLDRSPRIVPSGRSKLHRADQGWLDASTLRCGGLRKRHPTKIASGMVTGLARATSEAHLCRYRPRHASGRSPSEFPTRRRKFVFGLSTGAHIPHTNLRPSQISKSAGLVRRRWNGRPVEVPGMRRPLF